MAKTTKGKSNVIKTASASKKIRVVIPASISSDVDYSTVMQRMEQLMNKGSGNVTPNELAEIKKLAEQAQAYEQQKFVIEPPKTFAGILEMKMYELHLNKTALAQKLHVSNTKLSMIISGKQRPDIAFLKSVYKELNIDANLLLEAV